MNPATKTPAKAPKTESSGSTAGKRSGLSGGALENPDVLASSKKILQPTRPGSAARGLQQFFTPPAISQFARAVLGYDGYQVFDPTAGGGDLLSAFPEANRYGVELDPDHTKNANYNAIRGDIQHVFPLIRAAELRFPRIVANPPFGLDDWSDPVFSNGKKCNSTLLTYRYSLALLHSRGLGLFVAGRDRFNKLIAGGAKADSATIVATIAVDDLFDGVKLPCVVAIFTHATNIRETPTQLTATAADFEDEKFQTQVRIAVNKTTNLLPLTAATFYPPLESNSEVGPLFEEIQTEYDRRTAGRKLSQRFDVMLENRRLSIKPSPFALTAVSRSSSADVATLRNLHRQSAAYFALNMKDWQLVQRLERDGAITVDPAATEQIERDLEKHKLALRPMYPIPAQMRLGFLDDFDQIRCIKDSEDGKFLAGQWYSVDVRSKVISETEERVYERRNGRAEPRKFQKERKVLELTIGSTALDEGNDSIEFVSEHFELPDPGDLATNHPEAVAAAADVLHDIALENGFEFEDFQPEDLARFVVKERGLMAWAPGGGKTLAQLAFAEACIRMGKAKRDIALFVAPQDLHDQWRAELQKFLPRTERTLESISSPADAARVARHIKQGGTGWYIISYEALSIVGTKSTQLTPHVEINRKTGKHRELPTDVTREDAIESFGRTSYEFCPSCDADHETGWNGVNCDACGHTRYLVRVKNAGSILSTTFKHGVVCVDELSMVRGDTSQRSLALRGIRAACRMGASGTPISNYINDCFWGLAWCIGWGSARFPYAYEEGKAKFERDFCVIEYMMGAKDTDDENRRQRRSILPEVTNLSMLWKLLSINMIRRRQRDMGEMVERTFHTIEVPMGETQVQVNQAWLDHFPAFFKERNPSHPMTVHGLVDRFPAMLGMNAKLEYAATQPAGDPDHEWLGIPNISNFTPKIAKAIQIIEKHVAAGEKVLVGSCLVETGPFIADILNKRGIKARHITESVGGKSQTKAPKKRAKEVLDFKEGDTDVLCAGIQAMKLGHNLDCASVCVLISYSWAYEAFEQFLDRVWRRTSKKPVSVYCLIVRNSIDPQKYELLSNKAAASDVALDGQLIEENEQSVNWDKIIKQMRKQGIPITGEEIPEASLEDSLTSAAALTSSTEALAVRRPTKRQGFAALTAGADAHEKKHAKKRRKAAR